MNSTRTKQIHELSVVFVNVAMTLQQQTRFNAGLPKFICSPVLDLPVLVCRRVQTKIRQLNLHFLLHGMCLFV